MNKNALKRLLPAGLIFLITAVFSSGTLFSQKAGEWPAFHGSDRANKSAETGLLKEWPAGGPALIQTISGLGEGYASVSIAEGLIFTAGTSGKQPYALAYDLQGKLAWKKPNGAAWSTTASWAISYTGARSTPTYDNGVVYQLGEMGRLAAFRARTGEELWSRDLRKEFEAGNPEYGYSESVLVDGDYLFVRPAGKKGYFVCLEKMTGKLVWANTDFQGKEGYASSIIHDFGGYRQIIGASSKYFFGLDSKTGRTLWQVEFGNGYELNNTDAVARNEYVFLSTGYGKGSMLIRLRPSGKGFTAEKVWESGLMDNHHGGVLYHNGYLYGAGQNSRGWFCLDFLTGKQMWNSSGKGSLTYADGMLYLYDERGTMKLVKADPAKFEVAGEFKVPDGGGGPYWAHPVVCGGRLYLRHSGKIFIYSLTGK
ncbi:MAG: PQQ-like beta-propeller repeat protein [Bacteroidales bacterium]|nr:PQQ-like beta-propeller repeat protein [Bacteroidales bacterium]